MSGDDPIGAAVAAVQSGISDRPGVMLPIPLSSGVVAELAVPRDISEAERMELIAYIALAMPHALQQTTSGRLWAPGRPA